MNSGQSDAGLVLGSCIFYIIIYCHIFFNITIIYITGEETFACFLSKVNFVF